MKSWAGRLFLIISSVTSDQNHTLDMTSVKIILYYNVDWFDISQYKWIMQSFQIVTYRFYFTKRQRNENANF